MRRRRHSPGRRSTPRGRRRSKNRGRLRRLLKLTECSPFVHSGSTRAAPATRRFIRSRRAGRPDRCRAWRTRRTRVVGRRRRSPSWSQCVLGASEGAPKVSLCGCFSTGDCDNSLGNAISPLKAAPRGGKVLKVRWAYPCCGKSGGVRLVVVAYSETKRVHIAKAFYRSDDPSDDDIRDGVNDL